MSVLRAVDGYDDLVRYWKSKDLGDFQFAGRRHEESSRIGMYQYLCAYAYFAFVKGPLYAAQADEDENDFKIDHWLMRDGIRLVFNRSSPSRPDSTAAVLFDFGTAVLDCNDVALRSGPCAVV